MKKNILSFLLLVLFISLASNNAYSQGGMIDKFRQIYSELPTPNTYRTGGGAPGHQYWQQKADYNMQIRLDDEKQRIYGEETISYTNNSPDQLEYLWLQMDQNQQSKTSDSYSTAPSTMKQGMTLNQMQDLEPWFEENSNLYIFSKSSFMTTNARIGVHPILFETPRCESVDIDDQDSWDIAEAIALSHAHAE